MNSVGAAPAAPFHERPKGNPTQMATAVTAETGDAEVLRSNKPVIVDFWAEWCGPCHAVAPVLDRIVEERSGEVRLVKLDIDEEQEIAQRYGIASIPTMILFRAGDPPPPPTALRPKGPPRRAPALPPARPGAGASERVLPPAEEPAGRVPHALVGLDRAAAEQQPAALVLHERARGGGRVGVLDGAAARAGRGRLRPGDPFGEVALAMGVARTASVTAMTPAVVASCDRETFDEFLR